jgi:hypothetical protein
MGQRAHIDDPQILRILQIIPQQRGKVKMAEMVGADLHLKPILGQRPLWEHHDSRIVNQNVDFVVFGLHSIGELFNRFFVREVKGHELDIVVFGFFDDFLDGLFRLDSVTSTHNNLASIFSHITDGLFANTGVSTGHDGDFACEAVGDAADTTAEVNLCEEDGTNKEDYLEH